MRSLAGGMVFSHLVSVDALTGGVVKRLRRMQGMYSARRTRYASTGVSSHGFRVGVDAMSIDPAYTPPNIPIEYLASSVDAAHISRATLTESPPVPQMNVEHT